MGKRKLEIGYLHRGDTVMKALIRSPGETITEDMGIPGIEWNTGYPLTMPGWAGGAYILVDDYVPEDPALT